MYVPRLNSLLLNGFPILLFYETTRPERGQVWSSRGLLFIQLKPNPLPVYLLAGGYDNLPVDRNRRGWEDKRSSLYFIFYYTIPVFHHHCPDITSLTRLFVQPHCRSSHWYTEFIHQNEERLKKLVFIGVNPLPQSRGISKGDDGYPSPITDPDRAMLWALPCGRMHPT